MPAHPIQGKPRELAYKVYKIKAGTVSSHLKFPGKVNSKGEYCVLIVNGTIQRMAFKFEKSSVIYILPISYGKMGTPKGEQGPVAAPQPAPAKAMPGEDLTEETFVLTHTTKVDPDHEFEHGSPTRVKIPDQKWVRLSPSNCDLNFGDVKKEDLNRIMLQIYRRGDFFWIHNSSDQEITICIGEDMFEKPQPSATVPLQKPPVPKPEKQLPSELRLPEVVKKPSAEIGDEFTESDQLGRRLALMDTGKKNAALIAPATDNKQTLNEIFMKTHAELEPAGTHMNFIVYMNKTGKFVGYGLLKEQTEEIQNSVLEDKLVVLIVRVKAKPNVEGRDFAVSFETPLPANPDAAQKNLEEARIATEMELNKNPNPFLGKFA